MSANFHNAYSDGNTVFAASDMEAPLAELDKAISYMKNVIVHADGAISYSQASGQLTWSAPIKIVFMRSDGQLIQNIIETGGVSLTANQLAFADLSETNNAAIAVTTADLTTAVASNIKGYNRLAIGYVNPVSGKLYPIALKEAFGSALAAGDMLKSVYDTDADGKVDAAVTADRAAVNTFSIGDGMMTNKIIQANIGQQNSPAIRFMSTAAKWQYSNDGINWLDLGAGGGGTVVSEVNLWQLML